MPIVSVQELAAAKPHYLIIGGGTAGLVVAARLSEDPNTVVGVIEAGAYHKDDAGVNIPGFASRNLFKPDFDWSFASEPHKGTNNRPVPQPRGKGLGGSSLLNFTVAVRPTKEELNALEALGNPGWNWDNLWKYMKKSERLQPPELSKEDSLRYAASPDPKLHGTDGPIAKSYTSNLFPPFPAFMDTLEKLGLPRNPDTGGGDSIGSLLFPTTVDKKDCTRSYSASAYYAPNAERPNLLVVTGAHVTKILLEPSHDGLQRAVGVEFIKDEQTYRINASKEIILSAGAFQSPQILELSGIGNKKILKQHGIETRIDLPSVGENLQDHAYAPTIIEVDDRVPTMETTYVDEEFARQLELYKEGKGLFTALPANLCSFIPAHIFAESEDLARWKSLANLEASSPDVFADTPESVKRGIRKQYEYLAKWLDDPTAPMAQILSLYLHFPVPGLPVDTSKRYMSLLGAYTHPFARGSVHITSPSPFTPPAIKMNYLSNPVDTGILVKMQQFILKIYELEPAKEFVENRVIPPVGTENDEKKLEEYVRNFLGTVYHPVGTCAMLPKEDGGVVDSRLLVYGMENLRVIDCSILPLEACCNIQPLAYAIGEKGADIIKGVI
ncbi:unnamed protein product [Somion occarium]|uniref:Glucose-methanol-choline oxidoreductase N-terminal domain-containing protein n=1 Tax=Somion occarium TaxID=3059160 RepID=A0ABP1CNK7_9APHY